MDLLTPTKWVIDQITSDPILVSLVGTQVYDTVNVIDPIIYPFIVVQKLPGEPVTNASKDIIMFDDVVQVKAVDQGPDNIPVATIMARVLEILHKTSGSTATGTVIGCALEGNYPLPPTMDNGTVYQEYALRFRVNTQ